VSKYDGSQSHWSFSGRYWASWSATWAAVIAIVVSLPDAPDKKVALVNHLTPAFADAHGASSAIVSVVTKGFDFDALPASAFGDRDTTPVRR
jgi:hypothetical protein